MDVAERFRKQHKNVLRTIEGIECSQEFYRLNFEPLTYRDRRDLEQPMFRMTRDGFALLVMGFTGKQAMLWKERYIQAFNLMEAELTRLKIEHAETRGRSKTVRVAATDSYKLHGATEWFHYVNNTDAIYIRPQVTILSRRARKVVLAHLAAKGIAVDASCVSQDVFDSVSLDDPAEWPGCGRVTLLEIGAWLANGSSDALTTNDS